MLTFMESLLNIYLGVNQVPEGKKKVPVWSSSLTHMRSFDRKRNFSKSNKRGRRATSNRANVTLRPIKSENVGNVIDLSSSRPLFPLFFFHVMVLPYRVACSPRILTQRRLQVLGRIYTKVRGATHIVFLLSLSLYTLVDLFGGWRLWFSSGLLAQV
jgi:hypothetical protein